MQPCIKCMLNQATHTRNVNKYDWIHVISALFNLYTLASLIYTRLKSHYRTIVSHIKRETFKRKSQSLPQYYTLIGLYTTLA